VTISHRLTAAGFRREPQKIHGEKLVKLACRLILALLTLLLNLAQKPIHAADFKREVIYQINTDHFLDVRKPITTKRNPPVYTTRPKPTGAPTWAAISPVSNRRCLIWPVWVLPPSGFRRL